MIKSIKTFLNLTRILIIPLLVSCLTTSNPPIPGTGSLQGQVTLVPHEGVKPTRGNSGSYGDRRMRDVEFVDYSSPEFALVYIHETTVSGDATIITLKESRFGPKFNKKYSAVGLHGSIILKNLDREAHTFSCPKKNFLRRLNQGEEARIFADTPGEMQIFAIDLNQLQSTIFVVPGKYSIASSSGSWKLQDVLPGKRIISVWHPRFPPQTREIEIIEGLIQKIDFHVGVGIQPKP